MIKFKKPILIAEIGCNHMGDIEIAKKMIETAAESGADYVKFQKETTNIYLEMIITSHIQCLKTLLQILTVYTENS